MGVNTNGVPLDMLRQFGIHLESDLVRVKKTGQTGLLIERVIINNKPTLYWVVLVDNKLEHVLEKDLEFTQEQM